MQSQSSLSSLVTLASSAAPWTCVSAAECVGVWMSVDSVCVLRAWRYACVLCDSCLIAVLLLVFAVSVAGDSTTQCKRSSIGNALRHAAHERTLNKAVTGAVR